MNTSDKLGSLNIDTSIYQTRLSAKFLRRTPYRPADPCKILSFIPGTITEIKVKAGQKIKKGEELIILDAMKMQNILKSTLDGTVKAINVSKGDKVAKGTQLIELESD